MATLPFVKKVEIAERLRADEALLKSGKIVSSKS
jgi:hypothetical protein